MHELQVRIHELRVRIHDLRIPIYAVKNHWTNENSSKHLQKFLIS